MAAHGARRLKRMKTRNLAVILRVELLWRRAKALSFRAAP